MDDYLSMVWWNTSLSPPLTSKRNLATEEKIVQVTKVIKKFMDIGYDFICLGEVSLQDIISISDHLGLVNSEYNYAIGAQKQGRLYFDTAIFYKKKHNLVSPDNGYDCLYTTMTSGSRNLKVYERYQFYHQHYEKSFVFYLSHWPSQLQNNALNTVSISSRLRFELEGELDEKNNIILMGDYNVEPYSDEIVHHLQSSRDQKIVLKKPNVLYNPCWKFLPIDQTNKIKGTYNYSSGNFHTWSVIDQIMLSSSFLQNEWEFNDKFTSIVDIELLLAGEQDAHNPSDHWPLSTLIKWINHNV